MKLMELNEVAWARKTSSKVLKVVATIYVPYDQYNKENENKKAEKQIRRWIKEVLNNDAGRIPLYVEKDGKALIEDRTSRIRVTLT